MTGTLVRTALRRTLRDIKHVDAIAPGAATGLVAEVYRQAEQDFGMLAPPLALHSPVPGLLAASWQLVRETLLADGLVRRERKESVAAAVSASNSCPYCVSVHTSTMSGLGARAEAAALIADADSAIPDRLTRAVVGWARSAGRRPAANPEFPFLIEQAPELCGVVVTFEYLTRMVTIFLAETPLPPHLPPAARPGAMRILGRIMRSSARQSVLAGASAGLLPAAPLPPELQWASGNPSIRAAFQSASAAFEAAGAQYVPAGVRQWLAARLATWDGAPVGPGRSWARGLIAELPAAERAVGALVLYTALAPYHVDQQVLADYRHDDPSDAALIAVTSWASAAAAWRVGSWM
jgi:AhpD family alkylhydroperoxidase